MISVIFFSCSSARTFISAFSIFFALACSTIALLISSSRAGSFAAASAICSFAGLKPSISSSVGTSSSVETSSSEDSGASSEDSGASSEDSGAVEEVAGAVEDASGAEEVSSSLQEANAQQVKIISSASKRESFFMFFFSFFLS